MKLYSYCKSCHKRPYVIDGFPLERRGEGYRVISVSQGIENTVECYSCGGTGMKFEHEVTFNKETEQWERL